MDREEARRVAYHEAGHALAAAVFGVPIVLVSIRPGERYGGITVISKAGSAVGFNLALPVPLQSREARAWCERLIVVLLAGAAAKRLVAPSSGYVDDSPDEREAHEAAEALARLSPRHRELLTQLEAEPLDPSEEFDLDEDEAAKLSWGLAGDEAGAHLAWLRAVAGRLVRERFETLRALAEALMAAEVLTAEAIVAIVGGAAYSEPEP